MEMDYHFTLDRIFLCHGILYAFWTGQCLTFHAVFLVFFCGISFFLH